MLGRSEAGQEVEIGLPEVHICKNYQDAARKGYIRCLQALQEQGVFMGFHHPSRGRAGEALRGQAWQAAIAACRGHQEAVLCWLLDGKWPVDSDEGGQSPHLIWHPIVNVLLRNHYCQSLSLNEKTLVAYAASNGTLRPIIDVGAAQDQMCTVAAVYGDRDGLRHAIDKGLSFRGSAVTCAASMGHLACLRLAHLEHCKRSYTCSAVMCRGARLAPRTPPSVFMDPELICSTAAAAACRGHIECLDFVLRHYAKVQQFLAANPGVGDCQANPVSAAASNGHFNCLTTAKHQGCPVNSSEGPMLAASKGHYRCLRYLILCKAPMTAEVAESAAGHLGCLQLIQRWKCPWDVRTPARAAHLGNLDCLQFALDHHCPVNRASLVRWAALGGSLPCLRYLRGRQFPWGDGVLTACVKSGKLACLQNGCPREPVSMIEVSDIKGQSLEGFLRCAHKHGCPWGPGTTAAAARLGDAKALRFARENGCGWDDDTLARAVEGGSEECLLYALRQERLFPSHPPAIAPVAPSARCLLLVCEHMGDWAQPVLEATAKAFAAGTFNFDRPVAMALLLVSKAAVLSDQVMFGVEELRRRARALAATFHMAGKLAKERGPHAFRWVAMGSMPGEVLHTIAVLAGLTY